MTNINLLKNKNIKAVFFDMDGILFDSMPYHAEAWHKAMADVGLDFPLYEAYLHEGRTGDSTIDETFIKHYGVKADRTTKDKIYGIKVKYFEQYPPAKQISGVSDVLTFLKSKKIQILVVTGSAQITQLERIQTAFPNIVDKNKIISAFDVEHGKPHPEPYLKALDIAEISADEAIVIENAPLGVRSAVAAGIFTIAVNTGILNKNVLVEEGAHIVLDNMKELQEIFSELDL
ncbi:beta-phosphoglucomutase [Porphyromonadaceae bacterium COT-184 OH4590]|nr:beta-phosphoglucomutase [Porphyromonadaceae bacterium COT-184 OH4590]